MCHFNVLHIRHIWLILDPCVPVYCMNNGECQINNGQGECICPAGFTGGKCENGKKELLLD